MGVRYQCDAAACRAWVVDDNLNFPVRAINAEFVAAHKLNLKPLDDSPVYQMLVDNFVDVGLINIGVPRRFRIYHQHRTFPATIQATGVIDADFAFPCQLKLLNAGFCIITHRLSAMVGATGFVTLALIGAEEYVVFEMAHRK
jgi:hypothetical protein